MKDDDAARAHEPCGAFHYRRRVRIEHENISADSRVKFPGELHSVQISVMKRYVAFSERVDASLSGGHGGEGSINAHDLALFADQFRRHQRGVAPAAADIQHPHALLDT